MGFAIDSIRHCERCGLCKNQKPLLDEARACDFVWVGLSAKIASASNAYPLSADTNSGKIVDMAEEQLQEFSGYRTNLVKCPPLDDSGKLRYPNAGEIECCFDNLVNELEALSPKIVFLLGGRVASSIERHLSLRCDKWSKFEFRYTRYNETYFVPIQHPSYVYIYKRKQLDDYLSGIAKVANSVLDC